MVFGVIVLGVATFEVDRLAAVHEQEAHPLDGDAALERLVERCVEEYLGRTPAGGEVPGEELGEHELRPQPRRGTLPLIP